MSDFYKLQIINKLDLTLVGIMETYYRISNSWYQTLPPFLENCEDITFKSGEVMELVYPSQLSRVYIPINLSGDTLPAVFKAAHRDSEAIIYWYINTKYFGSTKNFHEMGFKLSPGKYTLTLMDDKGNKISKEFEVVSRE